MPKKTAKETSPSSWRAAPAPTVKATSSRLNLVSLRDALPTYRPIVPNQKGVEAVRAACPDALMESGERWPDYMKKTHKVFESEQSMYTTVCGGNDEGILPSEMAKQIYFNAKFGSAFFREGASPVSEMNKQGARFQLLLMTSTGNADVLAKFDTIFIGTLRCLADLAPELAQHVDGIFCRCEINPGKNLNMDNDPYANPEQLPCLCKLEIWIDHARNADVLKRALIGPINQKFIEPIGLPPKCCRGFVVHCSWYGEQQQRTGNWVGRWSPKPGK